MSAIPVWLLYAVWIAGEPVHRGKGGPLMPIWEGRFWFTIGAVPLLYKIWTLRWEDLEAGVRNLGESGHIQTLFGKSDRPERYPSDNDRR